MLNRHAFNSSITLICAAVASAHALAQVETSTAGRPMLEEVVVTAQKRTQSVAEVPISIQAFSAATLEMEKFESLSDLQFISPTVNFTQGSAGNLSNTLYMRGLGSYAFEGGIQPSVATTVDGVPLARSGEFNADLGDIERIEVVMGPQGTLYGRNSTGGVVNVVRKRPTEEFESSAQALATDDSEYLLKGMVSGPLSDNVRGRVNVLYRDRDDHIKNISPDGGSDLGGEKTKGIVAKLDVDISDSLNILFSGDYVDTDTNSNPLVYFLGDPLVATPRVSVMGNGDPVLGQKVLNDPFTTNANKSSDAWTDYEQASVIADLTWDLADTWTLHSLTSYRTYDSKFKQEIDGSPASPTNPMGMGGVTVNGTTESPVGRSGVDNDFDYITQEFRLDYTTDDISAIGGIFIQSYDEEISSSVPLLARGLALASDPLTSKFEQETWAVFGDVTYNLTQDLEIFGGLRWTEESADLDYYRNSFTILAAPPYYYACETVCEVDLDAFDEAGFGPPFGHSVVNFKSNDETADWSGRAGLKWYLSPETNIYASYSRGFIGIGVNYTRTADGENTWLDPSTADSYEIGFKSTLFDESLQLNGALYYMEVSDLQTTVRDPNSTATFPINAGDLQSQGVELSLNWAASTNLLLELGLAYTDAEIQDLENSCYPGQTVDQGCNILKPDGSYVQDLDGTQPPNIPEWKYTAAATYDLPLSHMPFDAYSRLSYVWQDDTQSGLKQDPLLTQDDFGILNLVVGITDKEGRYDISLFGKNITDEFYSQQKGEISALQLGYFQYAPREAQAYWGLNAKFFFQ